MYREKDDCCNALILLFPWRCDRLAAPGEEQSKAASETMPTSEAASLPVFSLLHQFDDMQSFGHGATTGHTMKLIGIATAEE